MPAANVSRALRAIDDGTTCGIPRRGLNPRKATKPLRCGIIQRSATGVDDRPGGRRADPRAAARHDREAAFERVGGQRRTERLYHGASMQEAWVIGADGVRLATRTVTGPADGPAFVLHHGLASSQHI